MLRFGELTPEEMPKEGVSAYEMFGLMEQKTIRALYLLMFQSSSFCTKFKLCA